MDDAEVRERVVELEARLAELESLEEPARTAALGTVQALLELYGEGLGRIVEHVVRNGGGALADALTGDELVSHLLLLHDLNPAAAEKLQMEGGFVPRSALTKR